MNNLRGNEEALATLSLARRIANYASTLGVIGMPPMPRPHAYHLGAVMADSILQAGVNYRTVVYPRVAAILESYPETRYFDGVQKVISSGRLTEFLRWKHSTKLSRFYSLARFFGNQRIHDIDDLRVQMLCSNFREELLKLRGVGPKTIDYMSCLVGIDNIAVDRHIRSFARESGVEINDYENLRTIFSYAADLLKIPRRDFDSWIWKRSQDIRKHRNNCRCQFGMSRNCSVI